MSADRRVRSAPRNRKAERQGDGFSDAELLALTQGSADWFWKTDRDHRFTWISDSFAELTGIPLKRLLGGSRTQFIEAVATSKEAAAAHLADLEAHRPFRDFVYAVTGAMSGFRWACSTGIPRFDDDGSFVGYIGWGRGATEILSTFDELDRTQRELADKREILHQVFGSLSAGLIVFGADDRLLIHNEQMTSLYPRIADALVTGAELRSVVEASWDPRRATGDTGTDEAARQAWIGRQIRGLWKPRTERVHQIDDGRWVHILNRRLNSGTLIGLRIDITALKQREIELGAALDRAKIAEETINGVTDALFVKDARGDYVLANRAFTELFGKSPEQVIGHSDFELIDRDRAAAYSDIDRRVLKTGEPYEAEERVIRSDGSAVTHLLRKSRISVPTGADYVSCMLLDITARKEQEERLAAAHDELQAALNEVSNYKLALDRTAIVAFYDMEGRTTYVNDRFIEVSQFDRDELIGSTASITDNSFHSVDFLRSIRQRIMAGRVWSGEMRNRKRDGTLWWAETTIVPLADKSGIVSQCVAVRYDITARKAAEAQMRKAQNEKAAAMAMLKDVIDTVPDAIVAYDRNNRLAFHNKAYKELYRLSAPAIRKGATFEGILRYGLERNQYPEAGKTRQEQERWLKTRLEGHRRRRFDTVQKIDRGRWVQVRDRRSQSGYVVGVRTDITAQRLAEAEIRRFAETDDLTGANNRKAFYSKLGSLLSDGGGGDGAETDGVHALAIFDLDRFKEINDTLGHDAGDEYICEVVRRLSAGAGRRDFVARLGGDEFAVVLTGLTGRDQAVARIARIRDGFRAPLTLRGQTFGPSASVGVALHPRDAETGSDLIKAADVALYEAKSGGRDRCVFHEKRLSRDRNRRQETALQLAAALGRDEIAVALQPQINLDSGELAGFEALARWRRADRVVMPDEFVGVASEHGLIVPLGQAVLEQSLAAMRMMLDRGVDPVQVAVNVAGPQLKLDGFADHVAAALSRHGIEPSRLEIEVTEEVLLDRSPELIQHALGELRRLGVTLALDDFGTGYASLMHLKQLKVDRLKIDRSFVHDIGKNVENTAISLAIINLAWSFGIEVVAEGIETAEQLDYLKRHGCAVGQGFLFGRPAWPEDVMERRDWSDILSVA